MGFVYDFCFVFYDVLISVIAKLIDFPFLCKELINGREKRMRLKERIYYVLVWIASFLVLLSVIVPHHHHADGSPCYEWLWYGAASDAHTHSHGGDHDHATDCTHNQALKPAIEKHVVGEDIYLWLVPIFSFFYLLRRQDSDWLSALFEQGRTVYQETLHTSWIPRAKGLRAPPSLI